MVSNKTKLWIKLGFFFVIVWLFFITLEQFELKGVPVSKKECYEWETINYECVCRLEGHFLIYEKVDEATSSTNLSGRICDTGNTTVYKLGSITKGTYIKYWECEPNKECIKWVRIYE